MLQKKKTEGRFISPPHEQADGVTRRNFVQTAFFTSMPSVDGIQKKSHPEALLRTEDDPVLSALARHRAALKAYNKACSVVDDVAAQKTGRKITAAAFEQFRAAEEEASRAFKDLMETLPQTFQGMRLFLIYLQEMDQDDMKAGLNTVIQSALWAEIGSGHNG